MVKKKIIKRKKKKSYDLDPNSYSNIVPQTIESFGNFLNNVRNPWLVIAVLLIICGGILIHELIGIKSSYLEQNELLKKEAALKEERKNLEEKFSTMIGPFIQSTSPK